MSHSFENFMGNKGFHPASWSNQKKLWEAEQRQQQEEKKQETLRLQYVKEQEIYKSKELTGKANPLNFMYEAPPGYEKKEHKEDKGEKGEEPRLKFQWELEGKTGPGNERPSDDGKDEPLKFDWQKEGRTAPREDYAKGLELRDQPFGIEVRNVKCFKCGKLGHVNTDKICPLYGLAKPAKDVASVSLPLPDLEMMEDGLVFRQCVKDKVVDICADNQQIIPSDEEGGGGGEDYAELLTGFSKKERRKILKKLAKMDPSQSQGGMGAGGITPGGEAARSSRKGSKSKHRVKGRDGSSSGDDTERRRKRKKSKTGHRVRGRDGSCSDEFEDTERKRKRKKKKSKTKYGVKGRDSEYGAAMREKRNTSKSNHRGKGRVGTSSSDTEDSSDEERRREKKKSRAKNRGGADKKSSHTKPQDRGSKRRRHNSSSSSSSSEAEGEGQWVTPVQSSRVRKTGHAQGRDPAEKRRGDGDKEQKHGVSDVRSRDKTRSGEDGGRERPDGGRQKQDGGRERQDGGAGRERSRDKARSGDRGRTDGGRNRSGRADGDSTSDRAEERIGNKRHY